jgi:hypothetical protein
MYADISIMRPSEKLKSDILRSVDGLRDIAGAREIVLRHFSFLPPLVVELIAESFEKRVHENRESGTTWLLAIGSIFLMEYDQATLTKEDWEEFRDIVSEGSGDLDMDTLTYAMDLVLEHRAI